MKTSALRKAISIVCVLTMLLSICAASFVGIASAQNTVADDVVMDFENDFKWSITEANDYTVSTGNTYVTRGEIVTDSEGDKAFQISHFRKKNGYHYFTIDNGTNKFEMVEYGIYNVTFDYFVKHSETQSEIDIIMFDAATVSADASSENFKVVAKLDEFEYRDDTEWTKGATYTFVAPAGLETLAIGVHNSTSVPEEFATVVLFDNVVVKTLSTSSADTVVAFDSREGSGCEPVVVSINDSLTELPVTTRYGYDFIGWKYDVTTGEGENQKTKTYDLTTSTKIPAGGFYAYAEWKLNDDFIVLDFRTNNDDYDAKVKPIVAKSGQKVTDMPKDPTYSQQKFVGWYLDRNFIKPFDVNCAPSTSTTLYAKWENDGIVIDFEDGANVVGSSNFKVIEEDNGNHLVKRSLTSSSIPSSTSRFTLSSGGEDIRIFEGSTYKITFKYKIEDCEMGGLFKIFVNSARSMWQEYKEQSGTFSYSDDTDGWVTGEFEFVATLADDATTTNVELSFGCSGDAAIYIDDIVVSCPENVMNIYGSYISLNINGGKGLIGVSGDPGDKISIPNPVKKGFKFAGWYTDSAFEKAFTEKTFGTEPILLYAKWQIGEFNEGFEEYPAAVQSLGIAGAYSFYNSSAVGFDSSNIKEGNTSLFRNGATAGVKSFTLMRTVDYALTIGDKYILTMYVKPTAISEETGTISLQTMDSNNGIGTATHKANIVTMGDLKEGEWQKIVYEFTADSEFLAIATTDGNDIYFDNISVKLSGFVDSPDSGDSTVSPIIVIAFVIVAAGALVVTGKKVFSK